MNHALGILIVPIVLSGCTTSEPAASKTESKRAAWTTSRVVGQPEPPPPFKTVNAFPGLKFKRPLAITRAPGTERLFVCEQDGIIYSFPNRKDATPDVFFDLKKDVKTLAKHPGAKEFEFVYGLAFHPKFAE